MTIARGVIETFFHNSPHLLGVVEITDSDIIHIFDNPAAATFFGKTQSELEGKSSRSLGVPLNVINTWLGHYRNALEKKQPQRFRYLHNSEEHSSWMEVTVAYLGESSDSKRPQFSYLIEGLSSGLDFNDNDQFYSLVNSIGHLAWLADKDGWLYWYNDRWYNYTGTTLNEMEGWGWEKVHHPDHLERVRAFAEEAWKKEEPWELTFPLRRKDGEWRWFLTRVIPLKNPRGEVVRWLGTNTDIHDQKIMEENLRKTQERLKLAVDYAHIGFYDWDLINNQLICSDKMKLDWGGPENIRLETIEDAFKLIHPEDSARVNQHIQETILHNRPYDIEYRVQRPDGKVIWVEVHGMITKNDVGTPVRFFGTSVDITERKRTQDEIANSEQEFREFIEGMPQIAIISNPDGSVLYYNQRHYDYFGLEPGQSEAWAWKDIEMVHPEDLQRTIEAWNRALKTGEIYTMECRLRRHDGEYRWHLGRSYPLKDKTGAIRRWVGTNTDIHEQKILARNLQESLNARDEFLSLASHELKTPMTSLKMGSQILKKNLTTKTEEVTPDRVIRFVDQVDQQINRINRLVDDMLDISRIRSGNLSIEAAEMDMHELLSDLKQRLDSAFIEKTTEELKFESCGMVKGSWDKLRIEQVITNLLTNALRYGGGKPVRLTLDARPDKAIIKVADEGIGIAPELQGKIFERFERGGISASEISGLGLGLYITKRLVEAHGGTVEVSSKPSQGSEFVVKLPRFYLKD